MSPNVRTTQPTSTHGRSTKRATTTVAGLKVTKAGTPVRRAAIERPVDAELLTDVSVSDARQSFKLLLDHAARGWVPTIRRSTTGDRLAVVDADRFRMTLEQLIPNPSAVVVHEAGEWSAFLPGLPISATGSTLDDAVDELVVALREYAEDFTLRLSAAPNHSHRLPLVQFVQLSTDDQLRDWLTQPTAA